MNLDSHRRHRHARQCADPPGVEPLTCPPAMPHIGTIVSTITRHRTGSISSLTRSPTSLPALFASRTTLGQKDQILPQPVTAEVNIPLAPLTQKRFPIFARQDPPPKSIPPSPRQPLAPTTGNYTTPPSIVDVTNSLAATTLASAPASVNPDTSIMLNHLQQERDAAALDRAEATKERHAVLTAQNSMFAQLQADKESSLLPKFKPR